MRRIAFLIGTLLISFFPIVFSANPANMPANPFEKTTSQWSDSLNTRCLGAWPTGQTRNIVCDTLKNLAFLRSGEIIYAIDLTDLQEPTIITELMRSKIPGYFRFFFYDHSSENLFIGTCDDIQIWDVSNPSNAQQIGAIDIEAGGIYVQNDYAYVTTLTSFFIIGVSNPTQPQTVGYCKAPGKAVAVSGSYAYLTGGGNPGFRIVDISDLENPYQISFLWQPAKDIFVMEPYVYLAGNSNLAIRIIDVTDPYDPKFAGYFFNGIESNTIRIIDRIAYIGNNGLRMVDVSNPDTCFEIGYFQCNAREIVVYGEHAFIANQDTGLAIIDVVPPSNPQQIGELILPHLTFNLFVAGGYAYMAYSTQGMRIIDISDPAQPAGISQCDTPGRAHKIFISGIYAYIADETSLRIVDVSIPTNPIEVGSLPLPGAVIDVCVSGTYAYVAAKSAGLRIIDISVPSAPFEVGCCDSIDANSISVSGHFAYTTGWNAFKIINISDPSTPTVTGSFPAYYWPLKEAFISGMYAYIISEEFHIVDISDPANPQEISSYYVGWDPRAIYVSGMHAYIVSPDDELIIVDIANPANPHKVGFYRIFNMGSYLRGVFVVGNRAYVAHESNGLYIFEFYGAGIEEEPRHVPHSTALHLLQNPVMGDYIELLMSVEHAVELELYNILGQKVRTYHIDGVCSGENKKRLDVNGLSSGVYFLKQKDQPKAVSTKVNILR